MQEFASYFVSNRWVPATGDGMLAIDDPVTETAVASVRCCSARDVDVAVASARTGFAAWSESSIADRREALNRLAKELRAREGGFIWALAQDIGAPVSLSAKLHMPMPLNNLDSIAAGLDRIVWEEVIGNARVVRESVGVIGGITPWNAPIHQMVAKIAGAIGAGCAIVLKPSELAPAVATLFFDAVSRSGLPDGVVNMVWGGPEVGEWLVGHPGIDMISFTGSERVGRKIMHAAAERLKPLSLELGGKSAAIVLDDADVETAVAMVVRQSMANSGQTCVCQSRLLVPKGRLAAVERIAHATAAQLRLGDPTLADTQMGPVRTAAQFERIGAMIDDAIRAGARCVFGGGGRAPGFDRGYFMAPTILSGVRPDMPLAQEEVFGPVLAIMTHDDDDEAVTIANATRYGLSGAVWSSDPIRAAKVAARMRAGQVIINGAPQNLAAPFGGSGCSGFGRENGRFSIEAFLQLKSLQGIEG